MLDSRLLHKTTAHLMNKVSWIGGNQNEWVHHGLDESVDMELIMHNLKTHLKEDVVYLVNDRTNSKAYSIQKLESVIRSIIGTFDFQIWSIDLERVIQFNKIGVLRLGQLNKKDQLSISV